MMDKKKRQIAEAEERLDVLGQESDKKAKKWIIEDQKEKEKVEKKKEERKLDILDETKKNVHSYKFYLCKFLHDLVVEIRLPETYSWGVWFDGKGIRVAVVDKFKKRKDRAFRITYEPKYDLEMCYTFAQWVEDIYDMNEGDLAIDDKNKIWTPHKPITKS